MRFVWSGVIANIKTVNIYSMLKKMITIGAMDARLLYGRCQICHPHSQKLSGVRNANTAVIRTKRQHGYHAER